MPPKATKKQVDKAKKKIVEDRTFGLKNKNKSKKVAQFVKTVEHNVKNVGKSHKQMKTEEQMKAERAAIKAAKEQQEKENAELFKTVVPTQKQTIAPDVDPKTVLCAFFKAGSCKRGAKCKFSHDMKLERKSGGPSLYHDQREDQADTMDKWDQEKLEAVIAKKAGKITNETQIVCKYFLDAIENHKYGWFWQCPTEKEGGQCIYKHRLPPGFVFRPKAEQKAQEDDGEDEKLTLVEQIEEERKKLDLTKCTPVTLETFMAWKAEKKKKKEAEVEVRRKEEAKKSGGKGLGVLSGRDLFKYDPSLFVDDADAVDDEAYEVKNEETAEEMAARLKEEQAKEEEEMDRRKQAEQQNADDTEEEATEDATEGDADKDAPKKEVDASLFEDDGGLPDDE